MSAPAGGLNWKVLAGSAGLTCMPFETNRRALAEAVHNVQRRQLFRPQTHAHALQLTIFGLGVACTTAIHPGQARRPV